MLNCGAKNKTSEIPERKIKKKCDISPREVRNMGGNGREPKLPEVLCLSLLTLKSICPIITQLA